MSYETYGDIRDLVRKELAIEGERFIQSWEMIQWANKGITLVESAIHNLYEDYFLTDYSPTVAQGDSSIDLPEDIFASRIRWLNFNDGSVKYKIKKIKLRDIPFVDDADRYKYLLTNSAAAGVKLKIFPACRVATSDDFSIWYIRNANRVTASDSVIDIPEYAHLVGLYIKRACAEKAGLPQLASIQEEFQFFHESMIKSLSEQTQDEENEIEVNLSIYQDMS